MNDWPPTVDVHESDVKDLDNLNLARKRPWDGTVQSSGPLFTDGCILFHQNYVAEKSHASELCDTEYSSNGRTVPSQDELEALYSGLDTEYVANVRGYVSRHPHAYHVGEHLALIAWKNWQRHWSSEAKRLMLVQHVVGDHKAYTGDNAIMVFKKPSGNIAAAMQLCELPVELKGS